MVLDLPHQNPETSVALAVRVTRRGSPVSGVTVRSGMLIDGISLETARLVLKEGRVDMADRVNTELVGGFGGDPALLRGNGSLVVGIYGHLDDQGTPCSLGLVTLPPP